MGIYANDVQKLYIAYFNRPADPIGLAYWEEQITKNGGSAAAVANAFSASDEYKSLFAGKSSAQIVETIYQNLFGRSAEPAGLTYWGLRLENGTFNVGNIATSIMVGAQGDDKKVVDNKVVVATAFTTALDTTAEILAYSGTTAAEAARTFLKTVGSTDASLTTAKAGVDAAVASIATSTPVNGTTYTLTTGVDTITGTSANDTIVATGTAGAGNPTAFTAASGLNTADKIVGGAGTDTLNITIDGTEQANATAYSVVAADVSGVEVINVRNVAVADTDTLTVNANNFVGATEFYSDRSTTDMAFTNVAAGSTVGFKGNGSNAATGNVTATYVAGATAAKVALQGGHTTTTGANTATLTVNGAGLTSATVTSTGGTNTIAGTAFGGAVTALTIDAQSNVATGNITGLAAGTTITVKGSGTANIGTLLATNVTKLDASAATGAVTATLNNVTGLVVTGGSASDVFTTGAVLAGSGLVDAGAGTADRLVVGTTAHIDATSGKLYKNFEQVQVNATAASTTLDVSQLASTNTINAVRINQSGAFSATVSNLTAEQAAAVSIVAAAPTTAGTDIITINVKDASVGGQIDTVKAALTTTTAAGAAQNIDLTGLTLTGVEKLELTGNGTVALNTGVVTLTTTNAVALDNIKFANAANGNSITIAAGHSATNLVVDASASTGGATIDASLYNTATGATLKGGSSFDVIEGTQRGDSIVGGEGNDVLSGTATAGQTAGTASAIGSIATSLAASTVADVFTGGGGRDVFGLGTNSALTTMSSITDLNLGGATAATGVDNITLDLTAGAATIVALTDTQKANIAAAASLSAAFDVAAAIDTTLNAVVQFVYGSDTYLFVNAVAAGTTYSATNDVAIKITGVTGTLDASDITII